MTNACAYWPDPHGYPAFPVPLIGYRNTGSGNLTYSSTNGYTWSASLNGVKARLMALSSSELNPSYGNSRGRGFPVRCIQA